MGEMKMKDFIYAALPWVIIGITLAIVMLLLTKNLKKKGSVSKAEKVVDKKQESEEETYMSDGMSLGICFGAAIGSAFMYKFGSQALIYGICFGMWTGLLVGMNLKKK